MRDIKVNLSTSETNNVGQIVVRQDDKDTQKIIADIHENGEPKNLAGYTVFFNARIKDGIIARDLANVTGSSQVSYVLKESFYQRTGRVEGFFSFEKNGASESTANFSYHVIAGCKRNIKQGNYIYELEQLFEISDDIIKNKDFRVLIESINEVNSKIDNVSAMFKSEIKAMQEEMDKEFKEIHRITYTFNDKKELVISHDGNEKYVKTHIDSVVDFEKGVKDIINSLKLSKGEKLWSGSVYPLEVEIVPSKKLNACENGWLIVTQSYAGSNIVNPWDFDYHFIPKTPIIAHQLTNTRLLTFAGENTPVFKQIYINNSVITGHKSNGEGVNAGVVISEVWSW